VSRDTQRTILIDTFIFHWCVSSVTPKFHSFPSLDGSCGNRGMMSNILEGGCGISEGSCGISKYDSSCPDRYRPKCRFHSQRVQNEPFFTTRVEFQTGPKILGFPWGKFKYSSLLMNSTRISFELGLLVGNIFQRSSNLGTKRVVRKGSFCATCSI